jgi:hypothetical protein
MRLPLLLALFARCSALGSPAAAAAPTRRQFVAALGSTLGAEAAWRQAVAFAAEQPAESAAAACLPSGAVEALEAGRVVVLKNWMSPEEARALRADAAACYAAGHFQLDALAAKKLKATGSLEASDERRVMPSFFASKGTDGPFVDASVGDVAARQRFKARVATLKTALGNDLSGRPSLLAEGAQTHEMAYTRYGVGARLGRHTDEHHGALKNARPVASGDENLQRLQAKLVPQSGAAPSVVRSATLTRRSVTWLVYLNDEYDAARDGGQLRAHERAAPSVTPVGARGGDLQVGWLKATDTDGETPVFLDASYASSEGGDGGDRCMLYACGDGNRRRNLAAKPFAASPNLFLAGSGDAVARRLPGLVDRGADRERFHLVDAARSGATVAAERAAGERGADGGERVRTIAPESGTLVLFDSVAVPHEVLATRSERYAVNGWFHEVVA